jgi:PTH1 family peptidyl-tRNA hydrolase
MENLYLVVGLGNPGSRYAETRHNAGFLVTEVLTGRWKSRWTTEKSFQALLARADRGPHRVMICQPQTFMNSSGEAVAAIMSFYRVEKARLMVVVDDADLPFGQLRLRPGGSSGGHHGLESIEKHIGSRDYARLRVGIGRQTSEREISGHVLSRFTSTEAKWLDKVLRTAADQIEIWIEDGIQKAMNRFNGVVNDPAKEEGSAQ